jgi:hypothetical protein
MKGHALLLWMKPCGIPVQVLFCSGKSGVCSLTTLLSCINCRFKGVLYSVKEAKDEDENIKYR